MGYWDILKTGFEVFNLWVSFIIFKPDQNILPYRTYIWEGPAEVPENPATPEIEYKAAWCFKYGEEEWMARKKFDDVKKGAKSEDKYGNSQIPKGRAQCS